MSDVRETIAFIDNLRRMCRSQASCEGCPIFTLPGKDCHDIIMNNPPEVVWMVEEWSKAHPIQTNGQKFVEVFGFEPTMYCKEGEEIHDFIADPQWWHEQYKAPKGE